LNIYVGTRTELDASAGAVFELVKGGVIEPNLRKRYALVDIVEAHGPLEGGRRLGARYLFRKRNFAVNT